VRGVGARRLIAAAVLASSVSGCSSLGYYVQAAQGEWGIMSAARPIDDWLEDSSAPEALKERLQQAREIRAFASRQLAEPDNASYTRYADLKRPVVVWNVFATPELSMRLKTWCYPFFGCASYRGYFDRRDAQQLAARLTAQGYDAAVSPVQAYSTLGWFDDPLLNTFIDLPEPELARLIFHELAHQVVYVRDDTIFNESFATAVEREGMRRWLQAQGSPRLRTEWEQIEQRHTQFLQLMTSTRDALDEVYAGAAPEREKRERKGAIFAQLQDRYHALRDGPWGGYEGYDRFFARPLNNAHLAAIGAYYDRVPAFEALMRRTGGDMAAFFREVKRIAALRKEARDRELDQLSKRVSSARPSARAAQEGESAERRTCQPRTRRYNPTARAQSTASG